MKIFALCKTFRGEEFAYASLESIYKWVSGVLYVHQENGWDGREGNTVREIVKTFPDSENKIHHLDIEGKKTQNEQVDEGVVWLEKHNIDYDYLMLIDTDEVWDDEGWKKAVLHIQNSKHDFYTCMTHTFIKSPFYRVTPDAPIYPVVFVKRELVKTGGPMNIRGSGLTGVTRKMLDVYYWHFCSVRKSLTEVWEKHIASCGTENEPIVNKEEWIKEKWNKLPFSTDLLPLAKHKSNWHAVETITIEELPRAVRNTEIVQAWKRYPQTVNIRPLNKDDLRKAGLPENFGPSHPDWNIPSKKNRFESLRVSLYDVMSGHKSGNNIVVGMQKPVQVETLKEAVNLINLPPSKRNALAQVRNVPGKLCITTMVSGDYVWYIPMFLDRILKEYPEATPIVFVRMDAPHPASFGMEKQKWMKYIRNTDDLERNQPCCQDAYTTAALRFTHSTDELEEFDFTLITDIDMLIMRETPTLLDQHASSMKLNGTDCYDNYISTFERGEPRIPGVHFVTKEWWKKTKEARAEEQQGLNLSRPSPPDYNHDEMMIGRIIQRSGLKMCDTHQHLWAHHGIHLGDWRLRIKNKLGTIKPDAFQLMYMRKLLTDVEFMKIAHECSPHLKLLKETLVEFGKVIEG
jgi:hypothetical protein